MMQTTLRSAALGASFLMLGGCCGTASMSAHARYGTAPPPRQQTVVTAEPAQPPPTTVHSGTTVHGSTPAQAEPTPRPTNPTPGRVGRGPREGTPVNTTPGRRPRPTPDEDTPFGSTTPTSDSLTGNIYFLPENTQSIPNLLALQPVGQVYTKRIDIPARSFDEGFPGVSDRFEWFAIRYTGVVSFPVAGRYEFRLNSDDGSKLYIDGQLVIDNDGQHSPRERRGAVNLTAGPHDIVIEYFQGPRYQIALQLYMKVPGGQETIFSLE
jgi:hypothetical protein